jgi:hypothetical protein
MKNPDCHFCNDTKKEPGFDTCVWCADPVGEVIAEDKVRLSPASIKRALSANNGVPSTTVPVDRDADYDALRQQLADVTAQLDEARSLLRETSKAILSHQAQQPMSNRIAAMLTKARAKVDRYLNKSNGVKP